MSLTQSSSFPGPAPSPCRSSSLSSTMDERLMQGTGKGDACTVTESPGLRMCETRPSIDTPAAARLRSPMRRVTDEDEGNTNGRKERLRGHMGVKTRALSEGWTIGPPADKEYAVDPVGVETMTPSDTASVRCCPSTKMSIVFKCGLEPRCKATSFITCHATSSVPIFCDS